MTDICIQFCPSVLIIYSFLDLEGGKFFFNTVKEGDSVLFATEDEQVRKQKTDSIDK